ncbi:hypothetical protein [Paucibacter sp. Y2R2-4]|uniref:hypothetical protein n=1 Tax=Paucibacter sp. Y2R2-4 TaxID=2893553 RepID=UPI0021E4272F|nr:hypothetical protein [Paucibacter sp. Y2R2-4]MCV2350660.1 hypothetical protein [Paucibacter sp. Y2R2-4]
MKPFAQHLQPNRDSFAADPFGYGALAWQKWAMVQTLAGFPKDPSKAPTSEDLKSPVLWLTHAHAMSEAAAAVLRAKPGLETMPIDVRGVCDSQFCAVGLMLVGYSLEICLKGMAIVQKGIDGYSSEERKYKHHRLEDLASFVPGLSEKDKAILQILTHFVSWAGRYPDPGSGRESNSMEIFSLSEKHAIAAKDLFSLAGRVMSHARAVTA